MSCIHSLLVAYFRIQQANREIPDMFLWPLIPLSSVIWSEGVDNGAKLLAIRCYAMQSGMGEAEREVLERQVLQGEPFVPDCPLEYGRKLDGEQWVVDGWMLPVIERDRILNWRHDTLDAVSREGYYVWDDEDVERRVDERYLRSAYLPACIVTLTQVFPQSTRRKRSGCAIVTFSSTDGGERFYYTRAYSFIHNCSTLISNPHLPSPPSPPYFCTIRGEISFAGSSRIHFASTNFQSTDYHPSRRYFSRPPCPSWFLCLFSYFPRIIRMEGRRPCARHA